MTGSRELYPRPGCLGVETTADAIFVSFRDTLPNGGSTVRSVKLDCRAAQHLSREITAAERTLREIFAGRTQHVNREGNMT
jgi:hypothetical protein